MGPRRRAVDDDAIAYAQRGRGESKRTRLGITYPTQRGLAAVRTAASDGGRGPHIHHTGELAVVVTGRSRDALDEPLHSAAAKVFALNMPAKVFALSMPGEGCAISGGSRWGESTIVASRNRNGCAPAVRTGHPRIPRPSTRWSCDSATRLKLSPCRQAAIEGRRI
jgi:hypothetical protein